MKRMNTIDRKEYIAFPGRQGKEKYYARLNIILWVINKNVLGIYYAEKKLALCNPTASCQHVITKDQA